VENTLSVKVSSPKVGFQFLVHEEKLVFILNNISVISWRYHGDQFYQWRKREYPEKITELPTLTEMQNLQIFKSVQLYIKRTKRFTHL
jgi:hypothetical protein